MIHLSYFICGFDSKDQSIDLSTNATNAIKEQFKGASKLHINIVFRLHFKQNGSNCPIFLNAFEVDISCASIPLIFCKFSDIDSVNGDGNTKIQTKIL